MSKIMTRQGISLILDQFGRIEGLGDNDGREYSMALSGVSVNDMVTPEKFGCSGNGVADDTIYFDDFLVGVTNKFALLTGTYKITSLLNRGLSNCILQGVPGRTRIFGSFDYRIIQLAVSQNVIFRDIEFASEYVNAVEDAGYSVFYSYATSLKNIWFQRCKFTAPMCNTSGLSIYSNTLAAGTNTVDGLFVDDCDFEDIGRIGCTLMNRSEVATKYDLMKRVRFNGNKGKNLGLDGSYGFLISLDGYGQRFSVDDNQVENALGIGIENTGWCDGSISGNTFDKFDRAYSPIGTSDRYQTGVKIKNNRCLSGASARSYFIRLKDCEISNNKLWCGSGVDATAAWFEDMENVRLTGNHYINTNVTGRYAAYYISRFDGCRGNVSRDEIFEGSSGNWSCLRMDGQGTLCYDNTFYNPVFNRPTGAFYDEVNGARGNMVIRGCLTLAGNANEDSFKTVTYTSDVNMTLLMGHYSGEVIKIINAALTVGRYVLLPSANKVYTVINGTAFALTFQLSSGGSTVAVAAGMTAMIHTNKINTIRLTADV